MLTYVILNRKSTSKELLFWSCACVSTFYDSCSNSVKKLKKDIFYATPGGSQPKVICKKIVLINFGEQYDKRIVCR